MTSFEMPASRGVQGPGEMMMCVGLQRRDLVERDLVVADDLQVERRVDLAEPLDEVVGERVVVVDQEDHGHASPENSAQSRVLRTEWAKDAVLIVLPSARFIYISWGALIPSMFNPLWMMVCTPFTNNSLASRTALSSVKIR